MLMPNTGGATTFGSGGSATSGAPGTDNTSFGNGGYGNTGNVPTGFGGSGNTGNVPTNTGGFGNTGNIPTGFGGSGNTGGINASGGTGAGGISPMGGTGAVGAGGSPMGGSGGMVGSNMPKLPPTPANCPKFTNGGVVQIPRMTGGNVPVTIYIDPNAKSKPDPGGPLIIYWHATLSNPGEVISGFGQANIAAVTAAGGVVAAPATTSCSGCTTTDDGYWYVEDDPMLDNIVGCAISQAKIDVTHIHTLGWSAGGLHTTHVAQARSNYIASFISYSGGLFLLPTMDQNPANHVAGILTYGDPGADVVILDFNAQSQSWYKQFQPMGWYSMMCHHPGGHEIDPQVAPLSLRFFMDHPYKVSPEPYASAVPSGYPSYCSNQAH